VSANGIVWPKLISYALYSVHIERYLVFTSSFVDLQLDLNDHLYHACIACYEFVILHLWKSEDWIFARLQIKNEYFRKKISFNAICEWPIKLNFV
jgi:hypothetical protein